MRPGWTSRFEPSRDLSWSASRSATTILFALVLLTVSCLAITRAYGQLAAERTAVTVLLLSVTGTLLYERRARRRLQDRLDKSLQDKHAFVSTISHDLRTPLTAVVGFSQLLSDDERPLDANRRRDYLRIVREQSQHLARMIEDTVDLARADEGLLAIRPAATSLPRALDSALAVLGLPDPGRFQVSIDPGTPYVWADPSELEQVLDRLLQAALTVSQSDVLVHIKPAGAQGAQVTLQIVDVDAKRRVLAPLRDGVGLWRQGEGYLGTAAARAIIELHGGRIWMEERGNDVTIGFSLPAAEDQPLAAGSSLQVAALAEAGKPS